MPHAHLSRRGDVTTCPVAVIVKEGNVLLGHRHYTPDKWKEVSVWTIPGGRCDEGESLEETLRREVQEETGITDLLVMAHIADVPGAKEGDMVPTFLCSTTQDATLMEPEKFSEWRWVPLEDFAQGEPEAFINEAARAAIIRHLGTG